MSFLRWFKTRSTKENSRFDRELLAEAEAIGAEFDSSYYLEKYGDVREAGVDPLHHFVEFGWREGRNPNSRFSTETYLVLHGDVKDAGVNPFWHYIVAGRNEGRQLTQPTTEQENVLKTSKSIQQKEREVVGDVSGSLDSQDIEKIFARLADKPHVFSISHDDYTRNVGGIQNCIAIEEREVRKAGSHYVHVWPKIHRTWLAPSFEELVLGLAVDGAVHGTFRARDLLDAIGTGGGSDRRLVIHSLLGHDPAWVALLASQCRASEPLYWTHDHAAICPSFALQRNDVSSCDGPGLDSKQCSICSYGDERPSHVKRVQALFDAINPIVVAPSLFSQGYIRQRVTSDFRSVVIEHCALVNELHVKGREGAVRVAFVGTRATHKGWTQFADLAAEFGGDERYEFHVFCAESPSLPGMIFHPVNVTQQGGMAMVDALRNADIDVAVLWSTWAETFCFTAHEVIAAGGKIITSDRSGNITSLVGGADHGLIFGNFADICEAFEGGQIEALAMRRRENARFYDLEFSRMSVALWNDEVAPA